jgi:hypothetical protein
VCGRRGAQMPRVSCAWAIHRRRRERLGGFARSGLKRSSGPFPGRPSRPARPLESVANSAPIAGMTRHTDLTHGLRRRSTLPLRAS